MELTAGGGGKSEARLEKVKQRNKGLAGQRVRRLFPFRVLSIQLFNLSI